MFVFIPGSIPPVIFGQVGTDPPDGSISPVTYIYIQHMYGSVLCKLGIPGSLAAVEVFTCTDIQGDQLNMAVYCWYIVNSDLSSVHENSSLQWTSYFLHGTR